jgi:hypothetical protein
MLIGVGRLARAEQMAALKLDCGPCGRRSRFAVIKRTEYAVLIFPIFAQSNYLLRCAMCWTTYRIKKEDADLLIRHKDDPTFTYEPRSTDVPPPGGRQRAGL